MEGATSLYEIKASYFFRVVILIYFFRVVKQRGLFSCSDIPGRATRDRLEAVAEPVSVAGYSFT